MSRDPRELSAALRRVVGGLSGGQGSDIVAILGCWDAVVGPQVAAHARPRRVEAGVLRVDVDEPGWATQLKYLRGTIIERVNEHLGADIVQSIELRVVRS